MHMAHMALLVQCNRPEWLREKRIVYRDKMYSIDREEWTLATEDQNTCQKRKIIVIVNTPIFVMSY